MNTRATALAAASLLLTGCTAVQSPVQNDLNATADARAKSNSGQNVQIWPDGTQQATAAQPDSGDVFDGGVTFQSTGLSAMMAVGIKGIALRNPGNLSASSVELAFGDPVVSDTGEMMVPIVSVSIVDLVNNVSDPIDSLSAQVASWVSALDSFVPAQQAAIIEALERDKAISTDLAGALREALGLAGDLLFPTP